MDEGGGGGMDEGVVEGGTGGVPGRPGTKSTGPVGSGSSMGTGPAWTAPGWGGSCLVAPWWPLVPAPSAAWTAGNSLVTKGTGLVGSTGGWGSDGELTGPPCALRGARASDRSIPHGNGEGGRHPEGAPGGPALGSVPVTTRAGIVVTGTEVLTGRVSDRNGPWLAGQLRRLGGAVGHVVVVGDRPGDMRAALAFLAGTGVALVITSGGLGPTADDLTAEVVGEFQGRPSRLDAGLEQRISAIVERLMARRGWGADPAATAAGVRKQARVPDGATVLDPVGTAPGLVVPPAVDTDGPTVLVLPGPPAELQGMWPAAVASAPVHQALTGRTELRQETVRLWGTFEAELAVVLREHEAELSGLEVTTCLREGELEIVTRYASEAQPAYDRLRALLAGSFADTIFSTGPTLDEVVATGFADRGLTVATA